MPRTGKRASRQLAAVTSDWLIRWHDVFQPITKLRFTQPNQSPHFQNCLCSTLSNPLHYYFDLSIHKSLHLSVVIVTLCKTCHTISSSQLLYRTNKDLTSQKIYLLQSSPLNQVDWCNCTKKNCCSKLQLVRAVLCLMWRHSQESFACREAWNSVDTRSLREKVFHPQRIATKLSCLALVSVWSLLFSPSLLNKFEWIISTELYMFP